MSAYTSVISGSPVQMLEIGNADVGKSFIFAAYPAGRFAYETNGWETAHEFHTFGLARHKKDTGKKGLFWSSL